jgi:hypothetical protein
MVMRYQQKRGQGPPNPIKLSKLRIRLVYPPDVVVPIAKITDRPAKNIDYTLVIDGRKVDGKNSNKTDGQGVLEADVPANAKSGTLTLHMAKEGEKKQPEFWKINLEIAELGSVHSSVSGEEARMNNLGLLSGKDPLFMRARDRFIGLFGVPDGTYIENRIEEVYGS